MKSWPFWPLALLVPLVSWEILWYGLVSSPNPRNLGENFWSYIGIREILQDLTRFLDVLCWARFMAQKPALPAVWPITVRHLSATDPAISVMVQAPGLTVGWAIPDPFISNWLEHLLYLSKRFCEEVCDCVCWYVNRADNTNRWHWVQEAVLVFSHILLSKIYQSIW